MKNLLVLGSFFILKLQLMGQPRVYRIEGQVENNSFIADTLYVCRINHILDFYSGNSALILNKVPIVNGKFSFCLNSDTITSGIIRFNIQPKNISNGAAVQRGGSRENCCFLMLEDNKSIRVTADALNFSGSFEVFPGGTNNSLKELRRILRYRNKVADSISILLSKSMDVAALDHLKLIYYNRLLADRPAIQHFVDTVNNVYAKFIGLHQLDIPHSLNDSNVYKYCTRLFIKLSSRSVDSFLLNSFRQLLRSYDRESYTLSNFLKANYKNASGEMIQITLRKKLTLIDFWASWCKPCRQANNTELQVINDLSKTQDFEIISISLDKNFYGWLEASKRDKITWNDFFDPMNFQSQYINDLNIRELPSTFLVDINGHIIARDIVLLELIKLLKN